jgi:hypothetical protein
MDRDGKGWLDGDALHRIVAERVGRQTRRGDWREPRDLALVLALSALGPAALVALNAGASPTAAWGLTALTAAAAVGTVRVLRLEYGLDLAAGPIAAAVALSGSRAPSTRWQRVALRLIPARHRSRSAAGQAQAGALAPVQQARTTRSRRPRTGA